MTSPFPMPSDARGVPECEILQLTGSWTKITGVHPFFLLPKILCGTSGGILFEIKTEAEKNIQISQKQIAKATGNQEPHVRLHHPAGTQGGNS